MSFARYAITPVFLLAGVALCLAQTRSTLPAVLPTHSISSDPGGPVMPVLPGPVPRTYKPLSVVGKLGRFARNSYGPDVFLFAAGTAGKPDIISIPKKPVAPPNMTAAESDQYDQALQDYESRAEAARDQLQEELRMRGRRFIAGMAEGETRVFLQEFMLPVIWRQDPRYFKSEGHHGVGYRMLYAVSRVGIGRSDSGHSTINFSRLLGAAGAAAAARYYYFDSLEVSNLGTSQHLLKSIGGSLALDGVFNVVREFWPHRTGN